MYRCITEFKYLNIFYSLEPFGMSRGKQNFKIFDRFSLTKQVSNIVYECLIRLETGSIQKKSFIVRLFYITSPWFFLFFQKCTSKEKLVSRQNFDLYTSTTRKVVVVN